VSLTHERRLGPGTVLRSGTQASYRALAALAGEPHLVRRDLVGADADAANRQPILVIAHITDPHVTDVQSPTRFEFVNREYADPRFRELLPMQRPQELLNVHAIAAMLRTVNAIDAGPITKGAIDLAVMSGDAVDNVQWNELQNFIALFDGGAVATDSGGPGYEGVQAPGWPDEFFWKPDGGVGEPDLFTAGFGFPTLPGLIERALKPFDGDGLRMKWIGCHGNHERVCQGVGLVTPELMAAMVGFHKPYRMPERIDPDEALETFVQAPEAFMKGPDIPVTPDAERRAFTTGEFVDAHGDGPHGFSGHARYVHDTGRVRFVVLDTVCRGGGAHGCIDEEQLVWLQERLEEVHSSFLAGDGTTVSTAHADRLVVIVSHHTLRTMSNTRGEGRARYVSVDEIEGVLHRFDNVVLWLNGHVHGNEVNPHPDPAGRGGGFWEVTTSSLVDWPCQARMVEVFDAGEGLIGIGCTMIDHDGTLSPGEAADHAGMAGLHRELAANVPFGGFDSDRAGEPNDRNVILLVRRPAGFVA
jgi:metallophosphoesterase (TIGR03767 family)